MFLRFSVNLEQGVPPNSPLVLHDVGDVVRELNDAQLVQVSAGDHLVLLRGQHGLRVVLAVG